jgi:ubiquinone/menaquinone biosynthesis C-methylase UbiE
MQTTTVDEIKGYWSRRGIEEGDDPHFTLPDYNLRRLEAEYVSRHLRQTDEALDVGCATGFTTQQFARCVRRMLGMDYSEELIRRAGQMFPADNLRYEVGDVTDLDLPDASFDVAITERCIINLPDWQTQQRGILEIARVLRPGGRYLMSESFEEGFARFAELRRSFGLEPMKRHFHNRLLREAELRPFLAQHFEIQTVEKMGVYYLVSRLVHPLLVRPDEPHYEAKINQVAVDLTLGMDPAALGDLSVNGLYVLVKKG